VNSATALAAVNSDHSFTTRERRFVAIALPSAYGGCTEPNVRVVGWRRTSVLGQYSTTDTEGRPSVMRQQPRCGGSARGQGRRQRWAADAPGSGRVGAAMASRATASSLTNQAARCTSRPSVRACVCCVATWVHCGATGLGPSRVRTCLACGPGAAGKSATHGCVASSTADSTASQAAPSHAARSADRPIGAPNGRSLHAGCRRTGAMARTPCAAAVGASRNVSQGREHNDNHHRR
jgi:hypothetical protein